MPHGAFLTSECRRSKPNAIYFGTQSGHFVSGWARALRFFHGVFSCETGRLAPFRYKVDAVGSKPYGAINHLVEKIPGSLRCSRSPFRLDQKRVEVAGNTPKQGIGRLAISVNDVIMPLKQQVFPPGKYHLEFN